MADIVDRVYSQLRSKAREMYRRTVPVVRRIVRFFALPYALIFLVDWQECTRSPFRVAADFLYIFFVLKDFPDYYTVFRLWEKERSEWAYYYGSFYNPYQKKRLQKEVQPPEYEILFADKHVCHQLLSSTSLPVPKLLGYLERHDDAASRIREMAERASSPRLIIKSSRGRGGRDVVLVDLAGGAAVVRTPQGPVSLDVFRVACPSIVQDYVQQHPLLQRVSPSVNTVRTETLLTRTNDVVVLGAFIRFGRGDAYVDNQCAGGLSVGVDLATGALREYAMDSRGHKYTHHPDSKVPFLGLRVPLWEEVLSLSERIQRTFPYYKLLGPDIAVTENGPTIIEINATPDHAGLEMDYGPTFRNRIAWRAFRQYDLLICRRSRELYLD